MTDHRAVAAAMALIVGACSVESGGPAYVAGEGYTSTIEVTTERGASPTVRVGEPLVLHARRTSGPWVEANLNEVGSSCWWSPAPPAVEPEVAGNLQWIATPGGARFDTDLRTDGSREVRFSEPGTYVLEARSTLTCNEHVAVDTLVVEVVP